MHAAAAPAFVPTATTLARTMRAAVRDTYGEPDVLRLDEVSRPEPAAGEVLVRVASAAATIGDHHAVTGRPYLIRISPYGGFPRPKNRIPGMSLAGVVEAVGPGVTDFRAGDEVFGETMCGAFAEHVVVATAKLAKKPEAISFDDAAAMPWAVTALQGLRDRGELRAGQRLLVIGASGGVGAWAVQIGKALGAHVTAVCGASNVDFVRSLGADVVLDYRKEDFLAGGARYDVVFDLAGARSARDTIAAVADRGTFVPCAGGGGDWLGPFARVLMLALWCVWKGVRFRPYVTANHTADLRAVAEMATAGKVHATIGARHPLSEVGAALSRAGSGHARGQTIVRIAPAL